MWPGKRIRGGAFIRRAPDGFFHGNVAQENYFARRVRRGRGRGGLRRIAHRACLAHIGHSVTRVDKNAPLVANLAEGRVSLHGPGLEELAEGGVYR